ncbi:MAG TPA: hypothetical protein VMK12_33020 [Anaeromyxobacteraceae bacterium]|nr:hypothetical protein [Anaeromyxobacteraceae bacterium]
MIRSLAVMGAFFVLGCATLVAPARRDASLKQQLDAHHFREPLPVVWSAARHLLAERGCKLAGRDRAAVGAPPDRAWKRFVTGGFETRSSGTHGLVLETHEDASLLRYRVKGMEEDQGTSRVTFVAMRRTGGAPSEETWRDLAMELELVRRLEPDVAARILAASETAARPEGHR